MSEFRQLADNKNLKLGTYIGEFATAGCGRILKSAGCDFAFVDMEHSGFTFETAKVLLRGMHDQGVATVLRPPSKEPHHLARACDIGAQGICPPMLGNIDQARKCVEAIKFPPDGMRGCALGIAHDDYMQAPVGQAVEAANRRTSFVALIETEEGIRNCDEIASAEGVDCIWLGHLDLSLSLGIPGQFDHPRFVEAIEAFMAAAAKHGKSAGRLVGSPEEGAKLHKDGCDFICYLGDVWLLQRALRDGFEAIRAAAGN